MKRGGSVQPPSDFILGMSLAEILLLLLFTFFAATIPSEEPQGTEPPQLSIEALNARIKELESSLKIAQDEIGELKDERDKLKGIIDALAKMTGLPPPTQPGEVPGFIAGLKRDLKRGHPRCDLTQNTLVAVSASQGTTTVELVGDPVQIVTANPSLRLSQGQRLKGDAISVFLQAVDRFSRNKDCRYDYSLTYATDADYRAARERFERHMYPAGIRQQRP